MEKKEVYESKLKNDGVVNFGDIYNFCFDWLSNEANLIVAEVSYVEKTTGNLKNVEATWNAFRKITDYIKYNIEVVWRVQKLKEIEYQKDGKTYKTHMGSVQIKVNGYMTKDYEGKYETSQFRSFLGKVYKKWLMKATIEEYEDRLRDFCDEFIDQTKAFMDLEAQKIKGVEL